MQEIIWWIYGKTYNMQTKEIHKNTKTKTKLNKGLTSITRKLVKKESKEEKVVHFLNDFLVEFLIRSGKHF